MSDYGYQCEYCSGTVQPREIEHEAFKYRTGFVILEGARIGVCDNCGNRYYSSDLLQKVHEIASGRQQASKTVVVPAAPAA